MSIGNSLALDAGASGENNLSLVEQPTETLTTSYIIPVEKIMGQSQSDVVYEEPTLFNHDIDQVSFKRRNAMKANDFNCNTILGGKC